LWRSTQVFGRLFTPIHKAGSTKTEAISKKLSFFIRPPGSNFPFHAASLLLIHHRHKKKSRFPRSWRGFWVEQPAASRSMQLPLEPARPSWALYLV
jgi:hypothetical protein